MKLSEFVQKKVDEAYETLLEVKEQQQNFKDLQRYLPQEIKDLDAHWYCASRSKNTFSWLMETYNLERSRTEELIRTLKLLGVVTKSSFTGTAVDPNEGSWRYKGDLQAGPYVVHFVIDGSLKPPLCHIEEVKEMKEVVSYKAICDETGKEV